MSHYNPIYHHRRSIRLQGYDYAQAGLYFITICCHNRECLFGEVIGADNNQPVQEYIHPIAGSILPYMKLNKAGRFADKCWLEIPNHFPNAVLHEYIVMPNHIHGIIEIKVVMIEDYPEGAENLQPLQDNIEASNKFQQMIPRSIGSIVKGFKIGVTKWFRNNPMIGVENFQPQQIWQRNYYEHIIRNEEAYQNISNYIVNNPAKWYEDKFYR